jgi:hypothetical protein
VRVGEVGARVWVGARVGIGFGVALGPTGDGSLWVSQGSETALSLQINLFGEESREIKTDRAQNTVLQLIFPWNPPTQN